MEHIAGAHDIAFADFNRGRMAHRPAEIGYGKDDLEVTAFTGDFFECHGESMLK